MTPNHALEPTGGSATGLPLGFWLSFIACSPVAQLFR